MVNGNGRKSAIRARMAETGLNYTGAMRLLEAEDAAKAAEAAAAKDAPNGSTLDVQFSSPDPDGQTGSTTSG